MFPKPSYQALFFFVMVVSKDLAFVVESREKRSDDASPLEAVVQNMAQQVTLLMAQLTQQKNAFNEQLSQLRVEIQGLRNKTDTLGRTVAFYAWNKAFQIHTTRYGILIFDHADTNMGNAYSPLTGVFTVPVSGLYHFQTTFLSAYLGSGQSAHAAIFIDSKMVAKGITDVNSGQYDQTTISSIVLVSAGQQVYVKNPDNITRDYLGSISEPHTTFSGFLLRAD